MEILKYNCEKPNAKVIIRTNVRNYGKNQPIFIQLPRIFNYLKGCKVEVTIKKVSGKVVK